MAQIDLGSIKFNWKGSYSGATAYVVDDVVESSGSSYICIAATTGNAPPNATYWELMSQKGIDADLLNISGTVQGDIYYNNGSAIARLGAGTSGDFLKTQGTGANPVWASAGGGLQSQQVFTSSGTYTKPSGINKIKVYVTGGGGGGGGNGSNGSDAGSGGGAGGTAIEILDATSITTVAVTVGTGGGGGTGTGDGGGGNTSSFGAYCSATGGEGGTNGNQGPVIGGFGGIGSNGDINLRGGSGQGGFDGTTEWMSAGTGGDSFWSGGGRGALSSAGKPGENGSGGGGGATYNTVQQGENGGDGIIVVEEYK